jgi:dUTP pyrophosphatase
MILKWSRVTPDAKAPERAFPTDAGLDFFAATDVVLTPGAVTKVPTGVRIHAEGQGDGYNEPGGWTYACLIWDKSGLGAKGVKVLGGVIDDGYTGEMFVVLAALDCEIKVRRGEKLAQVLVQRVELSILVEVETLDATDRGDGGFGHTGP